MVEVDNQAADALIEVSRSRTLHNDSLGQLVRNMYARLIFLENELSKQNKQPKTKQGPPWEET